MRTIIFVTFTALLAAACINTGQPVIANAPPPPPEASGGPPNSEQQGNAFSISTEAFYQASLHSTSTPGQLISLSLTPTRSAKMTTDFLDNSALVVDTGGWTTLSNGNLLLNLRRIGEKGSIALEFKTDGDKLIYTGSEYGNAGLTLWVKPLPESK